MPPKQQKLPANFALSTVRPVALFVRPPGMQAALQSAVTAQFSPLHMVPGMYRVPEKGFS